MIYYSNKRKYGRYYMENTRISFTAILYSVESKYQNLYDQPTHDGHLSCFQTMLQILLQSAHE